FIGALPYRCAPFFFSLVTSTEESPSMSLPAEASSESANSTDPQPTSPPSPVAATATVTDDASMPENAYRVLREGEVYEPIVPASAIVPEVTLRSVLFGLLNAVFWSAAISYLTLKLGQGLEAAIPIAILAIGFSAFFQRRSTLPENVNILALGATSGIIVGGSLFVMPAIHILGLEGQSSFFQIFFVPLLGAALGVLFLIPLRRYFVRDMHGKLPFPEGTAIAEVLVTGQKGGSQARVLLQAMGVGFAFDTLATLFLAWRENFTTAAFGVLSTVTDKFKVVFSLNTTAAIAGLGYLIGLRYAAFIVAGSMLSYFVIVPLFAFIGSHAPSLSIGVGVAPLSQMDHEALFAEYPRYIGIGAIFMAGLMSVIKMLPVMGQALSQGVRGLLNRRTATQASLPRTEQDIPMPIVLGLIVLLTIAIWVYFRFAVLADQASPALVTTCAVLIAVGVALLFSAVSSWAVAMISVTPISGMTLMTLIVSAVLLRGLGLTGREGMLGVLLIGGVVCSCLSTAGTLVTEFKVGYWVGATPRRIQWSNFAGILISAVVVTGVMLLLARVYGFTPSPEHVSPLPAPQANAMAAILRFILETSDATKWFLIAIGVAIAIIIELLGVSSLAVALGMYIPMEYNSPLLVGALVAHLLRKGAKGDEALANARANRGILVSSGLIAGGALAGVMSALVQFIEKDVAGKELIPRIDFTEGPFANVLGLAMFLGICGYIYFSAKRARREDAGPDLG
ncbi:MAG: oligopeptide transporter, OPT family, partial [Myxococcales bacterium]|nr:oligopeptide transporter, OPT family [Myxococcales bacterium]